MTEARNPRDLEADILLWLVRLPLALSDDLELLTQVPGDAVRRALEVLRRHGWLDRFELYSVEQGKALEVHALRPVAIPAFAHAFGLDQAELRLCWPVEQRDLLDRVASFEVTDDVNRFLASVADDYLREQGTHVLDLRALPRRRAADRPWPPLMDAYGCLHNGLTLPFFVAWDRPAVPAKHRSARVSAWYRARGDRDWPAILIVCPGAAQRRQWEQAIRIAAYRRDTERLEVAFAATKDAFGEHPTGRHWRPLGEDYAESMAAMLMHTAMLGPGLPRDRRLDLVDRGVDVRAPSLIEWAATRLTLRQRNGRERVAALRFALERGHWRVLLQLARHPYLTGYDLACTLGESHTDVDTLFVDLDRYRLVGSLVEEFLPEGARKARTVRRYFVTHAGLELLAAAEGVPALRYAEHSHLAVETSAKGRGGNRLRNLRRNWEHTIGVNAVLARLARDAAHAEHRLPFWRNESEATRRFEYGERRFWVRPDAAGVYYVGEERWPFLLEYDRGTMRRRDYGRKLAGIATFFKSGTAQAHYGVGLTVLVVSETDDGEHRFAEAVLEAERQWQIELPLLLTTWPRANRPPRGLLGPIWRTPGDPQRRVWLEVER